MNIKTTRSFFDYRIPIPRSQSKRQWLDLSTLVVLLALMLLSALMATQTHASDYDYDNVIALEASANLPYDFREALLTAKPGTVIELPEGTFQFNSDVILYTSHITIRGKGMEKTILSFKDQANGAEGIQVFADAFAIEDLAIEDTTGDGLRIEGANGVVINRVRVEWTNGPSEENGAYGIYPVLCNNVLIQGSVVRGASDAGIYVGQSKNIIVRNNLAEFNVAGIEIENSQYADVYGNLATDNTGGILVFDLPGLSQPGHHTRIFNNTSVRNNTSNFAPAGNIVGKVPTGTGIMILSTDHVEVFNNTVTGNKTTSLFLVSYEAISLIDGTAMPENFDAYPVNIDIHNNIMQRKSGFVFDEGMVPLLISASFLINFSAITDIIIDGITEFDVLSDANICIYDNAHATSGSSTYGNMMLDNPSPLMKFFGLFGGRLSKDRTPHQCANESWAAVELEAWPELPEVDDDYTEEEIAVLCNAEVNGVNWDAFVVDCPNLSSYGLFTDSTEPTFESNDGVYYELNNPLFTDYTTKYRSVFVPPNTQANYSEEDLLDFPVGTIISKTFAANAPGHDEQILEVRLLIHRNSGWVGLPYRWDQGDNETPADGILANEGGTLFATVADSQSNVIELNQYQIPRRNQCASCHRKNNELFKPIGPKAKFLNYDIPIENQMMNQLDHWTEQGILIGLPTNAADIPQTVAWDDVSAPLNDRARAYLDIQCAHCHADGGRASATGLFLNEEETSATRIGVCKSPVAAGAGSGGLAFDINPGNAEDSILHYRLVSNDPAVRMPELGRSIAHPEGIALIKEWIDTMEGDCSN